MKRAFHDIGFFIAGWLFIAGVVADSGAFAQEAPADARPSLEARKAQAAKLFDAVIAARQALPAYSATVTLKTSVIGQPNAVIKARAKDERLLVQIETGAGASSVACADGRLLLFPTKSPGAYVIQPVSEKPSLTNRFVVASGGAVSPSLSLAQHPARPNLRTASQCQALSGERAAVSDAHWARRQDY
ncbi:MAG: hypothetical protein CFK52_05325 [Chloracidobacterium sp. CP2_5A]|nr:MAG: hypothetical protein CFK52_05325 [Chloracidobacterium sp. CP2_5A]